MPLRMAGAALFLAGCLAFLHVAESQIMSIDLGHEFFKAFCWRVIWEINKDLYPRTRKLPVLGVHIRVATEVRFDRWSEIEFLS